MKPKLDIAFFGSSLVSAYWNGAATYYRGIITALHSLGYRITFYEPDAYERQQHRDIDDPDWATVVVYPATEKGVMEALDSASDRDLVIKTSGVGVFDELLEQEALERRKQNQLVVFWDVDAPATLNRVAENAADPFRELIPEYDAILTYGGGDPVVNAYLAFGARQCLPIYNALDPATHHPATFDLRFQGDLALLANRLPDRETRIEEFFFRPAEKLSSRRFVLGGNGWGDKRVPPNVNYVGHVYTRDHNSFNCSSIAVLNVNRDSMVEYGFSPPTRVFEAAGAGACLITDSWKGIELFLEPGVEVLVAESGDEVGELLSSLTPEEARTIGAAGRRRILAEHTYAHRAQQLQNFFEGEKFNTREAAAAI
ncbi:MAG: glycosyltransferase [Pyrinomonadaceae bacterium]